MNGPPTVNQPTNTNEQLVGKFHVVNVDKVPASTGNTDETIATTNAVAASGGQAPVTDESSSASRFQMIRVDRTFQRGRWKVNDYEPPENLTTSTNPPVNTIENEPQAMPNSTTLTTNQVPISTNLPTILPDSTTTTSAALAAAAAAFQQQQQQQQQQSQRIGLNNSATIVPPGNVPPPAGLNYPYPPPMPNMPAPNQSYLLPNHPQFSYYPFYPNPYAPYPPQWAALAPYLPQPIPPPQQQGSTIPSGNHADPLRLTDADVTSENPVIASNPFPNVTNDSLQNAQMAAAAAPFIYAPHHPPPHSAFVSQLPQTGGSPYATIASYHPGPTPPTILPPATQPLSINPMIPTNPADTQQQQTHPTTASQAQAPILTSPKHETATAKVPTQQSTIPKATAAPTMTTTTATTNTITGQVKPQTIMANGTNADIGRPIFINAGHNSSQIADLLSSSPSILNSQYPPPTSLLSPVTAPITTANNPNKSSTAALTDIWPYPSAGSPLTLSQAAAQTVAATATAMGLLSNENTQSTEITNEILKELTTPTKQNNPTDIDNKISAAMDLVKVHLLSAVRDEVSELRSKIRTLTDKVASIEHENLFLRQHVPSEILAQYTPLNVPTTAVNDSINPPTSVSSAASTLTPSALLSNQPTPVPVSSSLPQSLVQQQQQQQAPVSTTSQSTSAPPLPTTNLPQT